MIEGSPVVKKIKRHSFERRFGFADGPLSIKHGVACLCVLLLENRCNVVTKAVILKRGL